MKKYLSTNKEDDSCLDTSGVYGIEIDKYRNGDYNLVTIGNEREVVLEFQNNDIEATEQEFEELKKENEVMRNSLDNCLPIDKAENEDTWEKINLLINNEIEQEKFCNN